MLYPEGNWEVTYTKDNKYPETVLICKDPLKIEDSFRPNKQGKIICDWPDENALSALYNGGWQFTHQGTEVQPYYHNFIKSVKLTRPNPFEDTILNINDPNTKTS